MRKTYDFQDSQFNTDPVHKYNVDAFADKCIVIDNGSHSCRAGWSNEPHPKLIFRNLIAKLRGKKESDGGNDYFGNDIKDLEDMKWNIRTQFDSNVVTHFDIQETAFDYLFNHLGLNGENAINHPICITEALGIPSTLRQYMSEILFECYQIPKLAYGIDGLFSLHHNMPNIEDGIVVNCGYQVTHVLPFVNGKCDIGCSRRLNIGGLNMMIFARRLLQLQYPNHALVMNLSRTQELLMNHCYLAQDYHNELKKWQNDKFKDENSINIQVPVLNTATEKDLEIRKIQARRLKDINQKKREERIKSEEEQLTKLKAIEDLESYSSASFKAKIKEMNLKSEKELYDLIKDLTGKIEDRKSKSLKYFEELYNENRNSNIKLADDSSIEEIEKLLESMEEEKLSLYDKRRCRANRKQALTKRKSYASKERMRILSQLAKGGTSSTEKLKKEDTFGMKDEDWDVYKFINKNGSDSEDEQNQERLNEVEQSISHYQLVLSKLMVGRGQKYQYLSFDSHRHRIPEILYQPSMNGLSQEGIAGMITYVLKNYDVDTQRKLIKNVFITGGPSQLPDFKERLEVELMELLPYQSSFNVFKADDPLFDAWKGASLIVDNPIYSSNIFMSSEEYHENGIGYLKEHRCSNRFITLQ